MPLLTKDFALWYFFRLLHIIGAIVVGGRIIYAYIFPASSNWGDYGAKVFFYTFLALMASAGLVNYFLLKPHETMQEYRKPWIALSHTKLLLTIIFITPILPAIFGYDDKPYIATMFWFIAAFILISPFMRYYREYYTTVNRTNGILGATVPYQGATLAVAAPTNNVSL